MQVNTKKCNKCLQWSSTEEFYKDRYSKDGYTTKCKKCFKAYKLTNKDNIRKERHTRYLKNIDKVKAYNLANKQKQLEYSREYYKNNKQKYLVYNRKNIAKKRKTDIGFRILSNLRRRLNLALQGKDKANSTMLLIGCTVNELKLHLESQFTEGMTWENYGYNGWHIDHIKPCALFNFKLKAEQHECFHYTNLQPLWATDNIKKGKKYRNSY